MKKETGSTPEASGLDNYSIDEVIGLGGSSLVFSAYVRSLKQEFGVSLKVALKISTNLSLATQELEALVRVNQLSSFGNLHNAFLVTRGDLERVIGEKLALVESYLGEPLFLEALEPFPVIVLNYINGTRIISRKHWEPGDRVGKNEWTIEGFSGSYKEWVNPVFRELSLKERAAIFGHLVKAVADHHKGGEPHGDLQPGNIIWSMVNEDVKILDLGLKGNYGTPGWSSPEHQELREGLIDTLPLSSDIYVLGLWIKRIFPNTPPYSSFFKRCLHREPGKRPLSKEAYREVQGWAQSIMYKRLFWVGFAIILLSGFVWFTMIESELSKRFPDNGIAFLEEIKVSEHRSNRPRKHIERNLREISNLNSDIDQYVELRDNLIRALSIGRI